MFQCPGRTRVRIFVSFLDKCVKVRSVPGHGRGRKRGMGLKHDAASGLKTRRVEKRGKTLRVEGAHRLREFVGHQPRVDGRALNGAVAKVLLARSLPLRPAHRAKLARTASRRPDRRRAESALSEVGLVGPDEIGGEARDGDRRSRFARRCSRGSPRISRSSGTTQARVRGGMSQRSDMSTSGLGD